MKPGLPCLPVAAWNSCAFSWVKGDWGPSILSGNIPKVERLHSTSEGWAEEGSPSLSPALAQSLDSATDSWRQDEKWWFCASSSKTALNWELGEKGTLYSWLYQYGVEFLTYRTERREGGYKYHRLLKFFLSFSISSWINVSSFSLCP